MTLMARTSVGSGCTSSPPVSRSFGDSFSWNNSLAGVRCQQPSS
jgi:hypothetical protein